MTAAQVLSSGGLLSAALLTAGWTRAAGAVMVCANLTALALDTLRRKRSTYREHTP